MHRDKIRRVVPIEIAADNSLDFCGVVEGSGGTVGAPSKSIRERPRPMSGVNVKPAAKAAKIMPVRI